MVKKKVYTVGKLYIYIYIFRRDENRLKSIWIDFYADYINNKQVDFLFWINKTTQLTTFLFSQDFKKKTLARKGGNVEETHRKSGDLGTEDWGGGSKKLFINTKFQNTQEENTL